MAMIIRTGDFSQMRLNLELYSKHRTLSELESFRAELCSTLLEPLALALANEIAHDSISCRSKVNLHIRLIGWMFFCSLFSLSSFISNWTFVSASSTSRLTHQSQNSELWSLRYNCISIWKDGPLSVLDTDRENCMSSPRFGSDWIGIIFAIGISRYEIQVERDTTVAVASYLSQQLNATMLRIRLLACVAYS